MTDLDPTCVKQTRTERARRFVVANKILTTAVLAWACWLITRIADMVFADPAAISLHTVSAFALVVGILATVIGLVQSFRSDR